MSTLSTLSNNNEFYNEFYNILSDIIKILNGDEKCKDCENVSFIKMKFMKNI